MASHDFDVLIVGSGLAGLSAALHLAPTHRVAVITKRQMQDGSSAWAQGGIAAVLANDDSFEAHIQDTLVAGAGLCDLATTRFVVENAPAAIAWLRELGVPFACLSIDDAFEREVVAAEQMLQPGEKLTPLTVQNIQSRLRAQRMWNWSNSVDGLFLQTGNMSEKAVGYTTVGGDLMGCLAPIANLPKTVVNYLLDYLLQTAGLSGITETIKIPASAELAPNQEDERDLMPYPVLDACLALYAADKLSPAEIAPMLLQMFPEFPEAQLQAWTDKFARLFSRAIFKWVQSPLSLHLGNLDLERERALQVPVVTRGQWAKSATPSKSS